MTPHTTRTKPGPRPNTPIVRRAPPTFDPAELSKMRPKTKLDVEVTNNAKGDVFVGGEPVADYAAQSCKACHGTGIFGTKVNRDGSRTRLVCPCVSKEIQKRAAAE